MTRDCTPQARSTRRLTNSLFAANEAPSDALLRSILRRMGDPSLASGEFPRSSSSGFHTYLAGVCT